ncbi:MAG: hypothetical protein AABX70_09010 [Nanoarchaeota archaeon]
MKNIFFVLSVLVLMLVPTLSVQANTCAISTGHGLLQDVECDRVPDIVDNCPGFFNPNQADSNHNSVGDTCDQWYQSTVLHQSQPQPQVKMVSQKPVQKVVLKQAPQKVAEPTQTMSEEAFPYATVLTEETQVKLLSQHDVAAGGAGVVYPIRVLNKANRIKQYSLIAFNVDAFGTYRFDPGSVVLINPGQEKTLYLYVQADSTARVGEHAFTVRIESGSEMAQATLRANIFGDREEHLGEFQLSDRLGIILLTVLVLILLAGLVFVLSRRKMGNGDGMRKGGRKVKYSNY